MRHRRLESKAPPLKDKRVGIMGNSLPQIGRLHTLGHHLPGISVTVKVTEHSVVWPSLPPRITRTMHSSYVKFVSKRTVRKAFLGGFYQ
jgi:hypothetical protein